MRETYKQVLGFVLLFFLVTTSRANTNEFRGYWVDVFHPGILTSAQVTTLVDTIRAANCNAIVAEIRARANAYYNGSPYEPKGSGISPADFDPLGDLLAKGHDTSNGKQRLEIHAWMVMFKTSGTQPPAWMHKHYDGTVSTSEYDPGHPQVQERVFNVAMDIVSRYDVDGLNFDYVRYPENTPLGPSLWGYNDVSVARFNARYGRTGKPDQMDPLWNQFRRDQVTSLVRKIYLNVMAIKPWVKISADTITWNPSPTSITEWTNSARAYNDVLQDWRGWMEEGILDYSIPMNYYRHGALNYAEDFINWMNFAKDHQYERHTVIGPGTYLNFATNVITQFRLVREPSPSGNYARGICGYSYAFPSTNNIVPSSQMFQALVQPSSYDTNPVPIYAERATIPEMPWKTNPTKGHLKGFIAGGSATNYLDGANISIAGPMNRAFISDATGFFGSVHLLPGDYTLTASYGDYAVLITNFTITAGLVTTRDLMLAPSPPVVTGASVLFDLNPTNLTYLSTNTAERGIAYNPVTDRLLLVSRTPELAVHVLDGENGDYLHALTLNSNVTGGTYALQMIGVADDGVVYAGNLSLNNGTPFRLYRWSNDGTSSVPTVAFSDDPGLGDNQRWGDTFDVRGSGTDTQILLGSRLGTIVSILTTTNGADFVAKTIAVPGAAGGNFGLGVAFGQSNTFWGKSMNMPLLQVSFDLNAGTGTIVRTLPDPMIPNSIAPIGVSQSLNLVAGINFDSPDKVRVYDLASSGNPLLLATRDYATDNPNTFNVGSVDFGRDKVYALNPNNGILALRLHFPAILAPQITNLVMFAEHRARLSFAAERRPYTVEVSSNLINWAAATNVVPQDGSIEVSADESTRFYRLRTP